MVFQLFKKKDKDLAKVKRTGSTDTGTSQSFPPRLSAPSITPSLASTSSSSSASKVPPLVSSARTKKPSISALGAARPPFEATRSEPPRVTLHQNLATLSVPTQNTRAATAPPHLNAVNIPISNFHNPNGNGSWDDLGVPLSTSPIHSEVPPNRAALFGEGSKTGSSLSLPISPSVDDPNNQNVSKKSRWNLGGGAKKARSGSVASMSAFDGMQGAGKENSNSGFIVRSFRQVSRVHEDPISPGPYESLPASSPPLPEIPLPSPPTTGTARPPPSNVRAPAVAPSPLREGIDRAPSPTISVEAFRLASSSRSKSSLSLASATSFEPERPRFEPQRSRKGSEILAVLGTPLEPPRPQFSTPHQHSRSSSASSSASNFEVRRPSYSSAPSTPNLSQSESSPSISSYSNAAPQKPYIKRVSETPSDGLNDELRFIALYGAGETSPPTSPVSMPTSPPINTRVGALAPSLAVQPASPVPSEASTIRRPATTLAMHKVRASLSPSAAVRVVKASEQPKGRGFSSWNSSSSDEDSDESSSEEDDVPLSKLAQGRTSTSDLSIHSSSGPLNMPRKLSHELEVLEYSHPVSTSPPQLPRRLPAPITPPERDVARRPSRTGRRSMSTLSISDNAILVPPPTIPDGPIRAYSNPSSPTVTSSFTVADLPPLSTSSSRSPLRSALAQHKSGSSSSGSGSGLSLPQTPKDGSSPAPSFIDVKASPPERTIRFDVQSLDNEADRKWRSRMSTQSAMLGHQRSSSFADSQRQPPRSASAMGYNAPLSFARAPRSSSTAHVMAPQPKGDVYDRMKARHRAEAVEAEQIGKDLNGYGVNAADDEDDEDDEDDNISLSALAGRGRELSQNGSVLGSYDSSHSFHPPPSSVGGYSLALAPPGVDFYLYSSLPADQKQALHARSQQMMAALSAQAYQAKAESAGGWETGSNVSGGSMTSGGHGGSLGRHSPLPGSMSMGHGGMGMTGAGMWPPQMGMGQMTPNMWGVYPPPLAMPSSRLPPFAPSMAASQQFFQQPGPYYASSVVGTPFGSSSSSAGSRGGARQGPASTIGFSPRRG